MQENKSNFLYFWEQRNNILGGLSLTNIQLVLAAAGAARVLWPFEDMEMMEGGNAICGWAQNIETDWLIGEV